MALQVFSFRPPEAGDAIRCRRGVGGEGTSPFRTSHGRDWAGGKRQGKGTIVGDMPTGGSRYIFWAVLGLVVVVGLLWLVALFVPKAE